MEDQRGQEWKQMGSYLSLPVFWLSSGLILLSRELLEARDGVCLRGRRAQAVLLRPGCKACSPGLSSVPGDDLGHARLSAPLGSAAPARVECLTEESTCSPNRP